MQKIVFSIFLSRERVYRISLNKFVALAVSFFVLTPYFYIGFSFYKSSKPLENKKESVVIQKKLEVAPAVNKSVAGSKPIIYNPKEALMADYKISNIKISTDGQWLDVNFLLGKKNPSANENSGIIFLEAMNKELKIIATSEKSSFKFNSARFSKFRLSIPENVKVEKIKVKIISRSGAGTGLDPQENALAQIISI